MHICALVCVLETSEESRCLAGTVYPNIWTGIQVRMHNSIGTLSVLAAEAFNKTSA